MKQLSGAVARPAEPSRSGRRIAVTVERPDGSRLDVLISKPFARLGRDGRAEISLDDPKLLPCHAYLQATDEGVYVAGLAEGDSSGWLHPQAPLRIGGFLIRSTSENDETFPDATPDLQAKQGAHGPYPRLRVFSEKSPGGFTDFALSRRLTLVGRQLPSTWRIKHPTLSRIHCAMVWDDHQLWLVDLFSSNGTRVDEARFDAGMLKVGQDFRLGTVHCRYVENSLMSVKESASRIVFESRSPNGSGAFESGGIKESATGRSPPEIDRATRPGSDETAGVNRANDNRWQELRQELASLQERFAKDSSDAADERQRNVIAIEALLAAQADAHQTIAQLERRLSEQQQTLDEHRSIGTELGEKSAAGIAELTDRLRATSEEFQRQRQTEEHEREQIRTLVEKLRADAGDRQSSVETAVKELQSLAADLAARKTELETLTTDAAQHLEIERLAADDRRAAQDSWEKRLEDLSQEVKNLARDWRSGLAGLEKSLQEKLEERRQAEVDVGNTQTHSAAETSASHEKLAAELARLSTTVDAVQQQLPSVAAEMAQIKSEQSALKSELTSSFQQQLRSLAASGDDVGRRLKEGMAAVARQLLEQREETQRRQAEWQDSELAKVQQAAQQRKNETSRLERIENCQNEQLSRQNEWLAGLSELSRQTGELRQDWGHVTATLAEAQANIAQIKEALDEEHLRANVATGESRLNELAGDIERRAAEGEQQLREVTANLNSRLADFERAVAAELVDVQGRLREELAYTQLDANRKEPSVASGPLLGQDNSEPAGGARQPSPGDSETVLTEFTIARSDGDLGDENGASPVEHAGGGTGSANAPMPVPSATNDVPLYHGSTATLPSAESSARALPPGDTAAPEWLANDELTQRLLDFKTMREQPFRRRRLMWGLVVGGIVAGIVATATFVHLWEWQPLK